MNEDIEAVNNDVPNNSEGVPTNYDYSAQLEEITSLQRDTIAQLQYQNAILLETNNGLSAVLGFQNVFFCIAIGVIVVTLLWKVLSKWFFRGV